MKEHRIDGVLTGNDEAHGRLDLLVLKKHSPHSIAIMQHYSALRKVAEGSGPVHLFDYIALILAGGYCFSAFGIFLGFLCSTQAGARTLGPVFFLPHLLPSALSDVSEKLTAVAPLLPSYQLYKPLQPILLEDGRLAGMTFDWVYLLILGTIMLYLSWFLMKKRWLM